MITPERVSVVDTCRGFDCLLLNIKIIFITIYWKKNHTQINTNLVDGSPVLSVIAAPCDDFG